MAQRVVTTDDLDGTGEASTVRFSVDGVDYEIDLNGKNRTAFDKAVKPFVESARKVGGAKTPAARGRRAARNGSRKSTATPSASPVATSELRRWAADNGIQISPRGRISKSVIDQYLAAQ